MCGKGIHTMQINIDQQLVLFYIYVIFTQNVFGYRTISFHR